ncbi:uncharacterized protein K02A2.6-like [Ischnura elegans]|uniref:uncharacterized protein K02A2.6-like n=1 Tax=Ischnura elegans TaxID=197161 RepID=UPI001ED890EB|nr:uncharacterized protein K02A2.6-like [Ischnura elegans]
MARGNPQTSQLNYNARRKGLATTSAAMGTTHRSGSCSHVNRQQQRPTNQRREDTTRREERVSSDVKCYCCGKSGHRANMCKFKSYKCYKCGKVGHLSQVCRSQDRGVSNTKPNNFSTKPSNHYCEPCDSNDCMLNKPTTDDSKQNKPTNDYIYDLTNLFNVSKTNEVDETNDRVRPIMVKLQVEDKLLYFEVDSGACVSVINEQCYQDNFTSVKLLSTNLVLSSYTSQPIKPLGKLSVMVKYRNICKQLSLYVIAKGANPLMGRDWIRDLGLVIKIPSGVSNIIMSTNSEHSRDVCSIIDAEFKIVNSLYQKFPEVFTDKLGCYKGEPARLVLKDNVVPRFLKPRPIPFSLKNKVEAEIDRLVREGILSPVSDSEWGSPIVPIVKKTGELRLCADFRVSSLNDSLIINRHPIPRIEDLFNTLQKGRTFSKMDLSQAYQQICLDDQSKKLCTISTTKGLFMYNRVPYGVASAPGIFQKIMETILAGIPGVVCFLDDILITGENNDVHKERLYEVCNRLKVSGLSVSKKKCEFFRKSIEYLGYVLSEDGLSTSPSKISAIEKAPTPTDVSQLKAFLGMVNYYGKYVPHLSTIAAPLYSLLRKDSVFEWSISCEQAFKLIKNKLVSAPILAHYDPNLPVRLATDSSSYGLGCVLSQLQKDGSEKPICYASRTLSKAEMGYSVIDKEALGIIYGVRKFNQYLYGRKFTLITDHKPLISIFGSKKGLPAYAASRLQRYALFLTNYDFDIKYVKSQDNANADCLSRLPLNVKEFQFESEDVNYVGTYLQFIQENDIPVDFNNVIEETKRDVLLRKVYNYVLYGWPNNHSNMDNELKPYFQRQGELAIENGIIVWGHRIVVPHSLRKPLLTELHCGHLGIVKMKAMARSYFWWPGLDSDIENLANSCPPCLSVRQNPKKCNLHVWEYPKSVWERLHIDFLGPVSNKLYLVIVDAHSKWLEVEEVSSTSANQTITKLSALFARFGLPQQIVSDNGPPFNSGEFKDFLRCNGIKHTLSPPYHPATNGQAENSVKNVKKRVNLALSSNDNVNMALYKFLLVYRNSVHLTTNETPAMLMFGRPIRTRLDLIRPNLQSYVYNKQSKQVANYGGCKTRMLSEGQPVVVRDFRGRNKWIGAVIVKRLSAVSYLVKLKNDVIWKRHIDQIIDLNSEPLMPSIVPDKVIPPEQLLLPRVTDDRLSKEGGSPLQSTSSQQYSPKNTPPHHSSSEYARLKSDMPQHDVTSPNLTSRQLVKSDSPKQRIERRYPVRERRQVERLNL